MMNSKNEELYPNVAVDFSEPDDPGGIEDDPEEVKA